MSLVGEDGFIVSFTGEQQSEYAQFFRDHGFVVIRNVLSEEDIQGTLQEIWTHKSLLGKTGTIRRDDPSSWENDRWPSELNIAERGFLSADYDYHLQSSWNNRQNPAIYNTFSNLLNNSKLWVRIDRYGMMRPTRQITLLDGTVVDRPQWATKSNWLHWDQNPWSEPDFVRVQGLVTLTDSTQSTGGFHCVPAFHSHFRDWASKHEQKKGGIINVPVDDPIRNQIQKITMRAGSLLVWDSRLPHGNYPNESNQFRIVQYITFFPTASGKDGENERLKRLEPFVYVDDFQGGSSGQFFVSGGKKKQTELKYKFPDLTPLGKKLLGVECW